MMVAPACSERARSAGPTSPRSWSRQTNSSRGRVEMSCIGASRAMPMSCRPSTRKRPWRRRCLRWVSLTASTMRWLRREVMGSRGRSVVGGGSVSRARSGIAVNGALEAALVGWGPETRASGGWRDYARAACLESTRLQSTRQGRAVLALPGSADRRVRRGVGVRRGRLDRDLVAPRTAATRDRPGTADDDS